jgi:hypothetical protein
MYKSIVKHNAIVTHVMQVIFCLSLQLIVTVLSRGSQVRHGHDLDNETRPAGEMLSSLAAARLWVVLLPCEASLLPAVVDRVNQGSAEAAVEINGRGLEGTVLARNVLFGVSINTAGKRDVKSKSNHYLRKAEQQPGS